MKIFSETARGLSDILTLLNIAHKVVSKYIPSGHGDDDSIYILISSRLSSSSSSVAYPLKYIIWNFVNDINHLNVEYISNAISIWDATSTRTCYIDGRCSSSNDRGDYNHISRFNHGYVYHIPPLVPDMNILNSCIELTSIHDGENFDDVFYGTSSFNDNNSANGIDQMMPIDILFYGSYFDNEKRRSVIDDLLMNAAFSDVNIEVLDNLFGRDREAFIDQAKIVLDLNIYDDDDEDNYFPLNEHRIRYLLSKGKVVVSGLSGGEIQEYKDDLREFSNVVTFTTTENLFSTCISLLNAPVKRRVIEKKAVQYIFTDQRSLDNPNSSIYRVYKALHDVTSMISKTNAQDDGSRNCDGESKRSDSSNKVCEVEKDDSDDAATLALTWLQQTYTTFFTLPQYGEIDSDYVLHRFAHAEASAAYHFRLRPMYSQLRSVNPQMHTYMDKMFVIGYLIRRYRFQGLYVELGCNSDMNVKYNPISKGISKMVCVDPKSFRNVQEEKFLQNAKFFNRVYATSDQYFDDLASTTSPTSADTDAKDRVNVTFDIVLIDGLHEVEQAKKDLMKSLQYIHKKKGVILIHDLHPNSQQESVFPMQNPNSKFDANVMKYWQGDVWKLIPYMRTLVDVDLAVVDVDWGLGVLVQRRNPCPISVYESQELSSMPYDSFVKIYDQVVPFLSIHELHEWLPNDGDSDEGHREKESNDNSMYYRGIC